jgi:hypothetical protein
MDKYRRARLSRTIDIDPELGRRALDEAAGQFPEFAGRARGVVARPLFQGFAWQLKWDGVPPVRAARLGVSDGRRGAVLVVTALSSW